LCIPFILFIHLIIFIFTLFGGEACCAADMLFVELELTCTLWSEPNRCTTWCRAAYWFFSNHEQSPENIIYLCIVYSILFIHKLCRHPPYPFISPYFHYRDFIYNFPLTFPFPSPSPLYPSRFIRSGGLSGYVSKALTSSLVHSEEGDRIGSFIEAYIKQYFILVLVYVYFYFISFSSPPFLHYKDIIHNFVTPLPPPPIDSTECYSYWWESNMLNGNSDIDDLPFHSMSDKVLDEKPPLFLE
jgi:hypothetical protein